MNAETTDQIRRIADALHNLGNADAATSMGAIENLAKEIKEGSVRIENGLCQISGSLDLIAVELGRHHETPHTTT